ncbi:MAG TPA: response regulator [Pirellulales bacterium]|jgi:CheY-like chemotaxis protein
MVRVLIIDDNADGAFALGLLLKHLGCSVETCQDPLLAVDIAQQRKPQLVLLDLAMPKHSGFEVAKALRSLDLPPFLLVAISGRGESTIRDRCMAEGFDRFFLKPATNEQIYDLLILATQHIVDVECAAPEKRQANTRIDCDGPEASDNRRRPCTGFTSQDISRRTALSKSSED